MTPRSLLLISATAIAGWATGAIIREDTPVAAGSTAELPSPASERAVARKPPLEATVPPPSMTPLRSTDTLETLKPLRGGDLHARLALWLIDASPEDISAFWDHYRSTLTEEDLRPSNALMAVDGGMGTGRFEISELILYHWMRHDPLAAMAAAKRDHEEYQAWRAWTALDPQAAFDAALADGKRSVEDVARALGIYQASWLRQHLDDLPEEARKIALEANTGNEGDDPGATLRFLAKHGYGFRPDSFAVAIRDDPWAAYDWVEYLAESGNGRQAREQRDEFIRLAGEEHPEVIEALLRTTPEGALKRKMEDSLFRSRLSTDPEGAIQEAMTTKAPALAVDRLGEAGKMLASTDPERAFELAKRMFDTCPDAFDTSITIHHPGGSASYGGTPNQGPAFAKALMEIDPGRVLDLAVAGNDNSTRSSTFSRLLDDWSKMDPQGLSTWADGQSDENVHDAALYPLLMESQERGDFAGALSTISRIQGSHRAHYTASTFTSWVEGDPAAAAEWLKGSGLPAAEVETLRKKLPTSPEP
ncbi:hypothetical protein [Luteolibacter soli]|uniref:DUF4034 domain-containing protein n=1 Tax=Luteolibacter soli TaxID=3135280 RepID=A0ABU9AT12_9BACT